MSINKKYKLYVFDLDGTIAETKKDIGRALSVTMCEAGFEKPDEEQVVSAIGQGARKAVQKLTGLEGEALEPYVDIFRKKYDEFCCDSVALYPGTKELLYALKAQGALIALVTMKFRNPAHKILKAMCIDIFDRVISFDDVEKRKPDPESLFLLLKTFGLRPEDALMVGDSITDMMFAKAAGVDVCIMEHGYGDMSEIIPQGPTYILRGFPEFSSR
jgi:phosphoglycolate phosphatase